MHCHLGGIRLRADFRNLARARGPWQSLSQPLGRSRNTPTLLCGTLHVFIYPLDTNSLWSECPCFHGWCEFGKYNIEISLSKMQNYLIFFQASLLPRKYWRKWYNLEIEWWSKFGPWWSGYIQLWKVFFLVSERWKWTLLGHWKHRRGLFRSLFEIAHTENPPRTQAELPRTSFH